MDLSSIILGSLMTEKSERLKGQHVYVLRIHSKATKGDVQKALRRFFDIDVKRIRLVHVGGKTRLVGGGKIIAKRHPYKKALVTLSAKSKPLDVAAARSS